MYIAVHTIAFSAMGCSSVVLPSASFATIYSISFGVPIPCIGWVGLPWVVFARALFLQAFMSFFHHLRPLGDGDAFWQAFVSWLRQLFICYRRLLDNYPPSRHPSNEGSTSQPGCQPLCRTAPEGCWAGNVELLGENLKDTHKEGRKKGPSV